MHELTIEFRTIQEMLEFEHSKEGACDYLKKQFPLFEPEIMGDAFYISYEGLKCLINNIIIKHNVLWPMSVISVSEIKEELL